MQQKLQSKDRRRETLIQIYSIQATKMFQMSHIYIVKGAVLSKCYTYMTAPWGEGYRQGNKNIRCDRR